jgi:hypothetical protein
MSHTMNPSEPSIAFLFCTEGGPLEQESLLMAESFRRFTGRFKDAPLYSFQVRDRPDVSPETLAALANLGVQHQKVVLNTRYPDYPLANKPLLCAYAETAIAADILVFLDSDLVFWSEPNEFLLPPEYDLGIRPEHHKMIGSEGEDDPNDAYWQRLYQLAGVAQANWYVTTTVDQKRVRAFWNSGVVAARREAGIFSAWKTTLEKLLTGGDVINSENFYYEQSSLSATICAGAYKIWPFSPGYNYPIHSHNALPASEQVNRVDDIVCVHDHFFRQRKEWYRERIWVRTLKQPQHLDRTSTQYQWLCNYLQQHTPAANPAQQFMEFSLFLPGVRQLLPNKK